MVNKNKNIIKYLSDTYKVHPDVIEAICRSPFSFINSKMQDGDTKPIRLQYIGSFHIKKKYENDNREETRDISQNDLDNE